MQWDHPQLLHLLWLAPLLALLIGRLRRRAWRRLRAFADDITRRAVLPDLSIRRRKWRDGLWLAGITLVLVTFARPQWGYRLQEVERRGIDLMVVLDTSRSMLAQDFKPNRLQKAKWGIEDLVKRLQGDRIGLVAFAGSSFLQCPLTLDYAAFLLTLEDVHTGLIPRGGTALEQALRTALDKFDSGSNADKAILLITDGEDHEGDPLSVVEECNERGIRIFSIGVGTPKGDLIPVEDEQGGTRFLKNRRGEVVKSALEEEPLERLAVMTDGLYVRAAGGDIGVDQILRRGLSTLKQGAQEERMVKQYHERFMWFLWPALALFALEALIRERKPVEDSS